MEDSYTIKINNVTVYQQDDTVLDNISLNLKKGDFIYLIGKVGSGKSSFLKILYGELPIYKGEAEVCGFNLMNIKKRDIPKLRRKIGIVFQDFQLLTDRNVYQNLKFVLTATDCNKNEIDKKIIDVLTSVGMADKIKRMPHELSGGEQQRIVIARALLNNPELILADEPTGNLDPETSEGILKLLTDISKTGCTIIMATHNYSLVKKYPNKTFKCDNKELAEVNDNISPIDFDSIKNVSVGNDI